VGHQPDQSGALIRGICVTLRARGQAYVAPDVAERAAAGGAVAAGQRLAAEPLPIWASHALLVQAFDQVGRSATRQDRTRGWRFCGRSSAALAILTYNPPCSLAEGARRNAGRACRQPAVPGA